MAYEILHLDRAVARLRGAGWSPGEARALLVEINKLLFQILLQARIVTAASRREHVLPVDVAYAFFPYVLPEDEGGPCSSREARAHSSSDGEPDSEPPRTALRTRAGARPHQQQHQHPHQHHCQHTHHYCSPIPTPELYPIN